MPAAGEPGYKRAQLAQFVGRVFSTNTAPKQSFLEYEPYADKSKIPINTFKNAAPYVGKILSVEKISGPTANGETCNIVIEHNGDMPYVEGQSYGVIPPGDDPRTGKPNKVRLYSIASSRYGDDMTGNTATLVVKIASGVDPDEDFVGG